MIKKQLLYSFLLLSSYVFGVCKCDVILPMTFEATAGVPIIFYGKVKSVDSDCNEESYLTFEIIEQYKGSVKKNQEVVYQCGTNCGMSFMPDEKWIIYGDITGGQEITVDWCSRSRRKFLNEKNDIYKGLLESTFEEELAFLRANFEVNKEFKKGLKPRKFEQINPQLIPWLLTIGAIFMLVGYLVFGRKK